MIGDNIQLQQVVLNLVRNGIEAMGEADVETRRLEIRTSRTGPEEVGVSVSDRGPGLPAGAADKIFTAFHTTKAESMGMGLPISRSIIEAHGGRLWADANSEGGATFYFTLPVAPRKRSQ